MTGLPEFVLADFAGVFAGVRLAVAACFVARLRRVGWALGWGLGAAAVVFLVRRCAGVLAVGGELCVRSVATRSAPCCFAALGRLALRRVALG